MGRAPRITRGRTGRSRGRDMPVPRFHAHVATGRLAAPASGIRHVSEGRSGPTLPRRLLLKARSPWRLSRRPRRYGIGGVATLSASCPAPLATGSWRGSGARPRRCRRAGRPRADSSLPVFPRSRVPATPSEPNPWSAMRPRAGCRWRRQCGEAVMAPASRLRSANGQRCTVAALGEKKPPTWRFRSSGAYR
jgi:hypothetical protein